MTPVGAGVKAPPLVSRVAQVFAVLGGSEHNGRVHQFFGSDSRIVSRNRRPFGACQVASGLHERRELRIRHRVAIVLERRDLDLMHFAFFRIAVVRSHPEPATGDRNQPSALRKPAARCDESLRQAAVRTTQMRTVVHFGRGRRSEPHRDNDSCAI